MTFPKMKIVTHLLYKYLSKQNLIKELFLKPIAKSVSVRQISSSLPSSQIGNLQELK